MNNNRFVCGSGRDGGSTGEWLIRMQYTYKLLANHDEDAARKQTAGFISKNS